MKLRKEIRKRSYEKHVTRNSHHVQRRENANKLQRAGQQCKQRRTKEIGLEIKSKVRNEVHDALVQGTSSHYTYVQNSFYVISFPVI